MNTKRVRVQTLVSDATYQHLVGIAERKNTSLSDVAATILQTYLENSDDIEFSGKVHASYVTYEYLDTRLQEIVAELRVAVAREVAVAESRWESSASSMLALSNQLVITAISSGKLPGSDDTPTGKPPAGGSAEDEGLSGDSVRPSKRARNRPGRA